MEKDDSPVHIFDTHTEAEEAIRALSASGFDVKKLSLVGKGYHSEEHPVGFYTKDQVMKYETALKVDKYVLVVHGSSEEVVKARSVLAGSKAWQTA